MISNCGVMIVNFIFQHVDKITKQMRLEAQLADARLAKAKMEMAAEKEILLQEKQRLLVVIITAVDISEALLEQWQLLM